MAFVYWCFGRAAANLNLANPVPRTAGVKPPGRWPSRCPSHDPTRRASRQRPSLVVPGMVFYIDTGPTTGHSGLVADVIGGTLVTIEGNTNEGGSANGIGVFQRSKRKINDISIGFVGFA